MPAREPVDLLVEQGATFVWAAVLAAMDETTLATQPIDLTGCTARMQVRKRISDAVPLVELTTENGRIELGGPSGAITLRLSAAETAALPAGRAFYDCELVTGPVVDRIAGGHFCVSPEVTR